MKCSQCARGFHYQCMGYADSTFTKMAKATKMAWKCAECKQPGIDNNRKDETPKKTNNELILSAKIDDLGKKLDSFELSVQHNSDQLDTVIAKLNETINNYDSIMTRLNELEKENKALKKKTREQDDRIDALENHQRIENIEIRNVPETKGENVIEIVKEIGKAIGIESVKKGDIQVAHRVDMMNKERGNRPIIANMGSRYIRNEWLKKYKEYRNQQNGQPRQLTANQINQRLPPQPVYLSEHLTPNMKLLLKDTKEFAKGKGIKYVWTKDGCILVKRSDTDHRVVKIKSRDELEQYKSRDFN